MARKKKTKPNQQPAKVEPEVEEVAPAVQEQGAEEAVDGTTSESAPSPEPQPEHSVELSGPVEEPTLVPLVHDESTGLEPAAVVIIESAEEAEEHFGEQKPKPVYGLMIVSVREIGFRRFGRHFTKQPQFVPFDELDDEKIKELKRLEDLKVLVIKPHYN